MAKVIAGIEFENEVLKSDLPVLVDFFAEWCGPCKMIAPSLEALSQEMAGRAKVVKIDIDQANEIVSTYGIRSVPTLMFFKNGEIVDKIVGAVPKETMIAKINGMI
ncbi:MAG: thioredoxin [Clostridiales bacterium]|jgi:thioredoxin 1|nr:thioredoxin [Clostridiales bacterium]